MAYHIAPILATHSQLQGHSTIASLFRSWDFFVQLCSGCQDITWQSVSCGPSAIGELFVWSVNEIINH